MTSKISYLKGVPHERTHDSHVVQQATLYSGASPQGHPSNEGTVCCSDHIELCTTWIGTPLYTGHTVGSVSEAPYNPERVYINKPSLQSVTGLNVGPMRTDRSHDCCVTHCQPNHTTPIWPTTQEHNSGVTDIQLCNSHVTHNPST